MGRDERSCESCAAERSSSVPSYRKVVWYEECTAIHHIS